MLRTSSNLYRTHLKLSTIKRMSSSASFPIQKSESEWRAQLTPQQFAILREKSTERPGTGEYLHSNESGVYNCAACDSPLYKSSTKFDSHCGWPSFYQALPNALKYNVDKSHGMERIEMVCAQCGGHLGHVFKGEGYDNPTDERHCVNSISLKFTKD